MAPNMTDLKGVGPKMQKALEEAGFTDLSKIAESSIEDLVKVPGIGKAKATNLIEQAKVLLASSEATPTVKKEEKPKAKKEEKPKKRYNVIKLDPITVPVLQGGEVKSYYSFILDIIYIRKNIHSYNENRDINSIDTLFNIVKERKVRYLP